MLIFTKITQGLPLGTIGSLTCPSRNLLRGEELKCRAVQPTAHDAFYSRDEDLLTGSVATRRLAH
jgi:hypothetical protein